MAEQSGPSMAAIEARQAALAARRRGTADADRALGEVVRDAHAAAVTARERIDTIATEIADRVRNQAQFAVDTLLGAHEFQRYLLVKQRELAAVVEEAYRDATARRAVLETLRARYAGVTNTP